MESEDDVIVLEPSGVAMSMMRFNVPPGWPKPPPGWQPPNGWKPNPDWPPAPAGWEFWTFESVEDASPPVAELPAVAERPVRVESEQEVDEANPEQVEPGAVLEGSLQVESHTRSEGAETASSQPLPSRKERRKQQSLLDVAPNVSGTSDDLDELDELHRRLQATREELVELDDALMLQRVGIYEYHHPLENAEAYKESLREIKESIRQAIRGKSAIVASDRFAYNNSLAQGRKMTRDFSTLMLRAYNAEADSCVRSLRAGSLDSAVKRLNKAVETIARLGAMMEMHVSSDYHAIRISELELTSDYLFKVQEEREEAREERERLREERKAEQELAAERERLNKERAHYERTIATLREQGKADEAGDLERRVEQIDEAIEQNDFRAANIRAGYVYVISNIGAFGPNVVKIGLTRRLEPLDRVRELGDASVPFPFDVHAIYFSEDAVSLENELHAAFAEARLNQINLRREFFFATPADVRGVLASKVGNLLEFTEAPEATQYFQSQGVWPEVQTGGPYASGPVPHDH